MDLMDPRTGRLSRSTPGSSVPVCQRGGPFWANCFHAYSRIVITLVVRTVIGMATTRLELCLLVTMERRTSAKRHPKFRWLLFPRLVEAVGMPSKVYPMIKLCRLVNRASTAPTVRQQRPRMKSSRLSFVSCRRSQTRYPSGSVPSHKLLEGNRQETRGDMWIGGRPECFL